MEENKTVEKRLEDLEKDVAEIKVTLEECPDDKEDESNEEENTDGAGEDMEDKEAGAEKE